VEFTTVSYAIGGVFLFATLLMLGTRSGFISSGFAGGKLFPILGAILLLGFVGYNSSLYLSAKWSLSTMSIGSPARTAPAVAAPATHPVVASHTKTIKKTAPAAHWKTIIVDPTTLPAEPSESRAASEDWPQSSTPEQADVTPANDRAPPPAVPADTSRHDGRLKRAFHHVGRFLHIAHEDN